MTGIKEGQMSRGRQREKLTDCLSKWLTSSPTDITHAVNDMKEYRAMIANPLQQAHRRRRIPQNTIFLKQNKFLLMPVSLYPA